MARRSVRSVSTKDCTSPLKVCPFCGGEAKAFYCEESGTFDVQCQQCGAIPFIGSRTSEKKTMADVIAAWNARAERTCRNTDTVPDDGSGFYPSPHLRCSECGASYALTDYAYYCPNCGAKVAAE